MTVPGTHRITEFLRPIEREARSTPLGIRQRGRALETIHATSMNSGGDVSVWVRGLCARRDAHFAFPSLSASLAGETGGGGGR
jgi:hypothetical protein